LEDAPRKRGISFGPGDWWWGGVKDISLRVSSTEEKLFPGKRKPPAGERRPGISGEGNW